MKYAYEIEVNTPLEKVVKLAGDPANRMSWMDGIESYEPVSGTPGEVGSKSKMVFKTGNMKMTMVGTVVANNLPQSFTESIDASNLTSTAISKFIAIAPDKTKYISEQNFAFKGLFNKIVGFLLQGEFKKQTLRHMEGFKRFVEQQK
jgi:carbon monoxide dehydrogenase subunit G